MGRVPEPVQDCSTAQLLDAITALQGQATATYEETLQALEDRTLPPRIAVN
jgi:hypothetical protein